MKKKNGQLLWIPLWIDKWIFGSTRIELESDERGVWVDLMALAAKDNGFIRANPTTSYYPSQLCGLLNITEELLARTIKKCVAVDKLTMSENGILYLTNWEEFQFTDRYKREVTNLLKKQNIIPELGTVVTRKKKSVPKNGTTVPKSGIPVPKTVTNRIEKNRIEYNIKHTVGFTPLLKEVIDHLNLKIGTSYRSSTPKTKSLISARLNDGFCFDDFKRVIDIKVAEWKDDPEMSKFLRPETLFGTKFESYLQQKDPEEFNPYPKLPPKQRFDLVTEKLVDEPPKSDDLGVAKSDTIQSITDFAEAQGEE